jgi:hypothetical protein
VAWPKKSITLSYHGVFEVCFDDNNNLLDGNSMDHYCNIKIGRAVVAT